MRILRTTFLILFLFIAKCGTSQQLILGAGITPFSPYYTFSSLRLKAAVVNLVNRFGIYGMWELNPGNKYGRDAIGINYQLNCVFRVWAGIGVFEKGLIDPQVPDNILNGIRKEMGMGYISRDAPVQWEIGYSFTLGPTFQFYYEIPLSKKDRNGDGKYTNIDRSIPCTLEWLNRDSSVDYIVDTIWTNPKPSKAICEVPIPIDSFNESNATSAVFELPLHYENNQSNLSVFNKNKIKYYLVGILKKRTDLCVEIGSHTPCSNRKEYNQQLTQRRADTLKNHLVVVYGADTGRILARGYGESKLINDCKCEGSAVIGFTPYIDTITRKEILKFDKFDKYIGKQYLNYSDSEIYVFNNKKYVKCDSLQAIQNDRITLRFKKKIKRFAKIADTCNRIADSIVYMPNCRDNFNDGSIDFSKLTAETATNAIFDIPLLYEQTKIINELSSFDLLDSLASNILIPNPKLVLEIGSHTDCRQTDEFNMGLSQKRADSVVSYLITKHNINPKRLHATGYGESKLVNKCDCNMSMSGFTPYIAGVTQKMEVELDARGKQVRSFYQPYSSREIKIIDGNPYVPCNEKQHRQNKRTTLRFAYNFKDLCIEVPLDTLIPVDTIIPVDTTPPPMPIVMKDANAIENFTIERALTDVFVLPIFYDLDKSIIRPDAQRVLDTFAVNILNKYPYLITELGSHTDCRMPYEYNEKLAKRRADSAVAYLRQVWNIGPDRIVAVGYGETQLMNDCHCEGSAMVDYTPYIKGRTKKMLVELDDDGNIQKTIYRDYDTLEIVYFNGDPYVKCNEFQHRQNRRTTVRFANDPAKFGIKMDVTRDANNTNEGNSNTFAKGRKGGRGFIKEDVLELRKNLKDINDFDIKEAFTQAYVLPIFYDLDKAEIRPDAQKTLDSFMSKIMEKHPNLIAELGSHTDCRMPYDYNVKLSNRRADSAVNYLLTRKSLDPNRVVAVGYGETQLINDCACEDGTTPAGYTEYIPDKTKKMFVELDDDGNVTKTVYQSYDSTEVETIDGKLYVKCNEFQHRQNRRTTVRFANDPREFGLIIDQDVDQNNRNKK